MFSNERHRRVEHLRRRLDVVGRRQPQVLDREPAVGGLGPAELGAEVDDAGHAHRREAPRVAQQRRRLRADDDRAVDGRPPAAERQRAPRVREGHREPGPRRAVEVRLRPRGGREAHPRRRRRCRRVVAARLRRREPPQELGGREALAAAVRRRRAPALRRRQRRARAGAGRNRVGGRHCKPRWARPVFKPWDLRADQSKDPQRQTLL